MRFAVALLMSFLSISAFAQEPLRVAIVGLEHGHIGGFLKQFPNQHEVQLVGIVESDTELAHRYQPGAPRRAERDGSNSGTGRENALPGNGPDCAIPDGP